MEQHIRELHARAKAASERNYIRWNHVGKPEDPEDYRVEILIKGPQRKEVVLPPGMRVHGSRLVEGRGLTFLITATLGNRKAIERLTEEGLLRKHPDVELGEALKRIADAADSGKPLTIGEIRRLMEQASKKLREDN